MNDYVFSPSKNAFYPVLLKGEYEHSGTWPLDAIEVNNSVYTEFAASAPPEGKQRVPGKNGRPKWVAIPAPDAETLAAIAEAERKRLMEIAGARIDWLSAAQEDGDISAEENAELVALRAYRTTLRRLDLTAAPKVKWPEVPQSVA